MIPTKANSYEKYKQQDVLTANPVELIVMLYDGAIKQLKLARIAIEDKKIEKANISLRKAQDIVAELMNSLDLNYEISKELIDIYQFLILELVDINITKKIDKIQPIIDILEQLRKSWAEVSKKNRLVENIG